MNSSTSILEQPSGKELFDSDGYFGGLDEDCRCLACFDSEFDGRFLGDRPGDGVLAAVEFDLHRRHDTAECGPCDDADELTMRD